MNCADLETLLCDYIDSVLPAARRAELEAHLAGCPGCAELARDASAAVTFLERVPAIEPPPELLNRILFELPSGRHAAGKRPGSLGALVRQWLGPVLQPRFAMGMAMTILSFSMLGRFAGISPRQLTPADLNPVKIWQSLDDRLHRTWDRTMKFYEGLRVVYEIQSRVRDWTEQDQPEQPASDAAPAETPSTPNERKAEGK